MEEVKMKRIAIVTNVLPSYREGFYKILFNKKDIEVIVFCQREIPNSTLKTIHENYPKNVRLVKYFDFFNEKINVQFIPFFYIIRTFDLIIVDGNPRYLSHFFLASFLNIFAPNKIILWSMIHSFNSSRFTEGLRLFWTKLFKRVFVYNDSEAARFREMGFKGYCIGMNNGLNQNNIDDEIVNWNSEKLDVWKYKHSLANVPYFLSCTRLISKNKLDKFMVLMPDLVSLFPNCKWVIIGEGNQRALLEELIEKLELQRNVILMGSIYTETELAPWFLSAKFCLHPEAIGLSLLHSFGYGLPVLTHNKADFHGPEFAVIQDGVNSITYNYGDMTDLFTKVTLILNDKIRLDLFSKNAKSLVQEKYNTDVMASRFFQIVSHN